MNSFLLLLLILVVAHGSQLRKVEMVGKESLTYEVKGIIWPYTVCGKGRWEIYSVVFGAIPTRNTNDTILTTGTATDSVVFQRVDLYVKLNGVFLHSYSTPFAKPFEAGDSISFNYTNYIPSFAPPGTYTMIFTYINSDGKQEGCVSVAFKL